MRTAATLPQIIPAIAPALVPEPRSLVPMVLGEVISIAGSSVPVARVELGSVRALVFEVDEVSNFTVIVSALI